MQGPDRPADHTGLRKANLALVLRTLRADGPQSRARLARMTGLNKATMSSLVAELEQRRLVRLGAVVGGAIGRPGQLVELRPRTVCGIGLEANVDYAAVAVLDLSGDLVLHRRCPPTWPVSAPPARSSCWPGWPPRRGARSRPWAAGSPG